MAAVRSRNALGDLCDHGVCDRLLVGRQQLLQLLGVERGCLLREAAHIRFGRLGLALLRLLGRWLARSLARGG